jgi:hypothetical protein
VLLRSYFKTFHAHIFRLFVHLCKIKTIVLTVIPFLVNRLARWNFLPIQAIYAETMMGKCSAQDAEVHLSIATIGSSRPQSFSLPQA